MLEKISCLTSQLLPCLSCSLVASPVFWEALAFASSAQLVLRALEASGRYAATDKEVVSSHCRIKAALPVAGRAPGLEQAVLCWHLVNGH